MRRISIVGTSGSGKSTLAAKLAAKLNVPHVELDALHWEPGWNEVSTELMRERVAAKVDADGWVIDGNYSQTRDLVWSQADTVVWLNYSLPVILGRCIWRTLRRAVFGEPCCNGNRESIRLAFSRDSVVLWVLRTYQLNRRQYTQLLADFATRGGKVIILKSPHEAQTWLDSVP